MIKKDKINYKIDEEIVNNYVKAINSGKLKKQIKNDIFNMNEAIKKIVEKYQGKRLEIFSDVVKQLMNVNGGMVSNKMLTPLNISKYYISIMEYNNIIEKISRGIYISTNIFEDSYYCFQLRYKKAIFSHMNALYFYGMTEEFPYNYTITVPQSYHVDNVNKKCKVFYVDDDIYKIGLVEVETPSGNKVKAYDKERCICDIIRSKRRMDLEQVKKTIGQYIKSKDKNIAKLSSYAKKMGILEEVMKITGV